MPLPILLDSGPSPHGWHALEALLRCPQLYAYGQILFPQGSPARLESGFDQDNEPLLKGSLGHAGLAHHYTQAKALRESRDPRAYYDPDEAIALTAEKLGKEAAPFVQLAQDIVATYIQAYEVEDRNWTILEVEEIQAARIGPQGIPYTGRVDLVVKDPVGKVWIVDHKFVGKITPTIHQRYTLSGQFLGLQLFGRARWREQFGGCIVNLVSWGSSPRYARRQVESSPHALSGFTDVVSEAHALIERYKGLDPWQYPKALNEQVCLSAYGKCAGWDFCRFGKAAVRKSSP